MLGTVLVPLADGFEEMEAVAIIDILRRAGAEVTTASVKDIMVTGAHGMAVRADTTIDTCREAAFDLIALPGGMPGASNLALSSDLTTLLNDQNDRGGWIGAICAAPAVVLKGHGILPQGKMACYPSFRDQLPEQHRTDDMVAVSGNIITGAGPGAAPEFALELIRRLAGDDINKSNIVSQLIKGMLIPQ